MVQLMVNSGRGSESLESKLFLKIVEICQVFTDKLFIYLVDKEGEMLHILNLNFYIRIDIVFHAYL